MRLRLHKQVVWIIIAHRCFLDNRSSYLGHRARVEDGVAAGDSGGGRDETET